MTAAAQLAALRDQVLAGVRLNPAGGLFLDRHADNGRVAAAIRTLG